MAHRTLHDANTSLRELKNALPLAEFMGLAMTTVQRMLGASLIASLGVWFLQGTVMDGVLTLIALCALTGVIWAISERESTFDYLNLSGSGPWNMLAVILSIVVFAQLSISIWAFPTTLSRCSWRMFTRFFSKPTARPE